MNFFFNRFLIFFFICFSTTIFTLSLVQESRSFSLPSSSEFGYSVVGLPGTGDFLIGAPGENRVYIFRDATNDLDSTFLGNGSASQSQFSLQSRERFGSALAIIETISIGTEFIVAVGSLNRITLETDPIFGLPVTRYGGIYFFRMSINGTVIGSPSLILSQEELPSADLEFGRSISNIGDLFNDTGNDVMAGIPLQALYGFPSGTVMSDPDTGGLFMINMNSNYNSVVGTSQEVTELSSIGPLGGFTGPNEERDMMGTSVASFQHISGGQFELFVGSPGRSNSTGVYWFCTLTDNQISPVTSNTLVSNVVDFTLSNGDRFGSSLAFAGDIDQDGLNDLWIGAPGGSQIFLGFLNADGTIRNSNRIIGMDSFGFSSATLDVNADSVLDLIVGDPTNNIIYIFIINPITSSGGTDIAPTSTPSVEVTSTTPTSDPNSGTNSFDATPIIASVVVVVVVCICICLIGIILFFILKKKSNTKDEKDSDVSSHSNITNDKLSHHSSIKEAAEKLNNVITKEILGQGQFGRVYRGLWGNTEVALKEIKSQDIEDLEQELTVLLELNHPNILRCFGIWEKEDSCFIVTEFMNRGDLLSLLQEEPDISGTSLIAMSSTIANGMCYLHQKKIIHRDLACRNILASGTLKGLLIKISDFGLSRIIDNYYSSNNRKIPVRWTSPESLKNHKFTKASDVWSFGVTLWEIFTRGNVPYCDLSNQEIIKKALENELKLQEPWNTPEKIIEVINTCMKFTASDRPSFEILEKDLGDYLFEIEQKESNLVKKKQNEYDFIPNTQQTGNDFENNDDPVYF